MYDYYAPNIHSIDSEVTLSVCPTIKMASCHPLFEANKINKDEISLEKDGKDPIVFGVNKDGDEYKFKATTSAIKKKFGDLTLSPSK